MPTSESYAPFPEAELLELSKSHDSAAKHAESSFTKGLHEDRAEACRNALKSFEALRDRCHEAELMSRQGHAAHLASFTALDQIAKIIDGSGEVDDYGAVVSGVKEMVEELLRYRAHRAPV